MAGLAAWPGILLRARKGRLATFVANAGEALMARMSKWRRLFVDEIPRYLAYRGKKGPLTQLREIVLCAKTFREVPYHYLTHTLYARSEKADVLDFIPTPILHRLQERLNPAERRSVVDDKALFSRAMREAGLAVADDVAYLHRDGRLEDADRTEIACDELCRRLLAAGVAAVFVKPTQGGNGLATSRYEVTAEGLSLDGIVLPAKTLHGRTFGPDTPADWHEFTVQRLIRQHPTLNHLHETAVCTVRIDTLLVDDEVLFNAAAIRVGRPGQVNDGWTFGGFMIAIDLETGALGPVAHVKPKNWTMYGGILLDRHPRTGKPFAGLAIPHWAELLELVRRAALVVRPLACIGWDVAVTADGPVLVEANHDYDMFMQQEAARGLRHTPLGRVALGGRAAATG